jgi:hypothetical protein
MRDFDIFGSGPHRMLVSRPAPAVVDTVVLLDESGDEVYRLKPVKRNECCSIGLMVKSTIFPI